MNQKVYIPMKHILVYKARPARIYRQSFSRKEHDCDLVRLNMKPDKNVIRGDLSSSRDSGIMTPSKSYPVTFLMGLWGALYPVYHAMRGLSFGPTLDVVRDEMGVLAYTLAVGLCGDLVGNYVVENDANQLQDEENPLVRMLGKEYYCSLVDEARIIRKCSGKILSTHTHEMTSGTAVFKDGHNTRVTLTYEQGEANFIFKYLPNTKHRVAKNITSYLIDKGCEFVPNVIVPDEVRDYFHNDNEPKNRGVFYEWIGVEDLETILGEPALQADKMPGLDEVKSIIDKSYLLNTCGWMGNAVGNAQAVDAPIHSFHNDLVDKLDELGDQLMKAHECMFGNRKPMPVHGDLHQGNVLGACEYIIDWENAHLGIPYHDFAHFSVVSDFDRSVEYSAAKDYALERQRLVYQDDKNMPIAQTSLIESEVRLSLLDRYFRALKSLKQEYREGVEKACKYLLVSATNALEEHSNATGNRDTLDALIASRRWQGLEKVAYDSRSSVAYAHSAYHKHRQVDKESLACRQVDEHIAVQDNRRYMDSMIRSFFPRLCTAFGANLYISTLISGSNEASKLVQNHDAGMFFLLLSPIFATSVFVTYGAPIYDKMRRKIKNSIREYLAR